MTIDTAELRRVVGAMTPGHWFHYHGKLTCHSTQSIVKRDGDFDWICSMQMSNCPNCRNDGDGIAYLHNSALAIADHIDAQAREIAELRAEVERLTSLPPYGEASIKCSYSIGRI